MIVIARLMLRPRCQNEVCRPVQGAGRGGRTGGTPLPPSERNTRDQTGPRALQLHGQPLRFLHARWHSVANMPIRPEHRFFCRIDWAQLSAVIRFGRAKGCCEGGRAAPRADGLSSRRQALAGRGCRSVARWMGAPDPDRGRGRHPRPRPADPRGPGRRPSGPRHLEQRECQPRGLLTAVPHDPRPPGASEAALADVIPAEGPRGSVRRALRLTRAVNAAYRFKSVAHMKQMLPITPTAHEATADLGAYTDLR